MGGASNIRAPKPQEYTPVYQKDGNYYKQDAPKQSAKGHAMRGPQMDHNGNPMKVMKGKGKASTPSYSQIGGGMSQTADMKPLQANRFQIGNYQPQAGAQTQTGFVNDKRGLTGRGGEPTKIAPYRGGVGSMIGKGMF